MFLALTKHEIDVPPTLAEPGASYWRALSLSSNMPWYLVTLKPRGPSEPSRSMLFWWDIDLVDTLQQCGSGFDALTCFRRQLTRVGDGWLPIAISEVWKGSHPHLPEHDSPMLITTTGELICGPLAQAAPGAKRSAFVAKQVSHLRRSKSL